MQPKEFIQRWIQGMKNLTPAQQLHAQMLGYIGNIFGILFAGVFLVLKGFWYFLIFIGFTCFLQLIAYIEARQKYYAILEFEKTMKGDN